MKICPETMAKMIKWNKTDVANLFLEFVAIGDFTYPPWYKIFSIIISSYEGWEAW